MGARYRLASVALDNLIGRASTGRLSVGLPDGSERRYVLDETGPEARIELRDTGAIRRAALGGSIGFAEGYMEGLWDTPDLLALLAFAYANMERTAPTSGGAIKTPLQRAIHSLRENTPRRARRNIAYHYDLGNDFYRLWLDDDLTYSAALFESEDAGLSDAQLKKWDRLLDILQPGAKDHLLEIGCGWGGFALHAAKQAGCKVTGVTLSQEQHDFAVQRVAEEGLENKIDIRLQDYRDIDETYAGIASIEMFEAVGEKYWPLFFARISDLLESGKRAAVQTITICEDSFERYRSNPDFIQRYIFPGGMLPSPERFTAAARAQGLHVNEPEFFGHSYAHTLELWLERFDDAREQVMALGFDERFVRMWRYYLAYCQTGFRSGNVDVMQVSLER